MLGGTERYEGGFGAYDCYVYYAPALANLFNPLPVAKAELVYGLGFEVADYSALSVMELD